MPKKRMSILPYFLCLLTPVIYFGVSWFFPWEIIQFKSSISVSYIFDILFSVIILLILKRRDFLGKVKLPVLAVKVFLTILVALLCVWMIKSLKLVAPFQYIEYLALQLLVLAPLIEELVFRGAFVEVCEKLRLNNKLILVSNSLLFSLSHLPALWTLPAEFHHFIGFQVFYTFFLGWVCTKSRLVTKGLVEPILIHFIFNFVFYLAVIRYSL
ncbi:MAG: CPBP family intramembrane metalloprotease [Bacteriovoracaceae bacterium]|jgi:membrane protease YdiL (CAAX protease family)|nr:hypothetical protein [Halobacteriovoraceae bacterium]MDP7320311.1 CPBP family intramembrane metalloprotease [Bacteriovoracaceae bacterium]